MITSGYFSINGSANFLPLYLAHLAASAEPRSYERDAALARPGKPQ